jgi:hypothetical protein
MNLHPPRDPQVSWGPIITPVMMTALVPNLLASEMRAMYLSI